VPLTLVLLASGAYVDSSTVPKAVVNATCEMAKELLIADRTAAPVGEGITSVHTGHTDAAGSGATGASDNSTTVYNKTDTRPIISHVAQAMLSKFGTLLAEGAGTVRLERV